MKSERSVYAIYTVQLPDVILGNFRQLLIMI